MKQITLKVEFTLEDQERIRERYHFEKKDKDHLYQMVGLLGSLVRAKAWYKVCQAGEIEGIPYRNYVVVLVTLSEYIDRLIALESEAGNLLDAYMLDCIALEFLDIAYQQVADKIYKETQLWQGGYQFPGEQIPLELLPLILEKFSDVPVTLHSSGMMSPVKSVVYLAKLVSERQDSNCCICLSCKNQTCIYRSRKEISNREK